ncbi:MAG: hypothetical protein HYX69_23280 [Planctomycetia bacterium]|nr:hypothetical protein [Planctomycetia bacterium]
MVRGRIVPTMLVVGLAAGSMEPSLHAAPPDYGAGPQGIIRQGAVPPIDAFPFGPLFGYPAANLGSPQPSGHQVIPTGPNGYVYRPVTDLGKFIELAVRALKSGDYQAVLVQIEPVVTEQPGEGYAWLIRAQALFGLARYTEAAESLHTALRLLPQERWGQPVVRFREYFASAAEYTARLRALEWHVRSQPQDPAGHYLLGYHYGYLGHEELATRELAATVRLLTGKDVSAGDVLAPSGDEPPRPGLPREDPPPVSRRREF